MSGAPSEVPIKVNGSGGRTPPALENPTVNADDVRAQGYALSGQRGFQNPSLDEACFVFFAPPKTGKSTLALNDPNALCLDFDGGGTLTRQARAWIEPGRGGAFTMSNWDAIMRWLATKPTLPDGRKPTRIIIDSLDAWVGGMEQMLTLQENAKPKRTESLRIIYEYGSEGSGYMVMRQEILARLILIRKLGYTWTLCGHQIENRKMPGSMRPAISPTLATAICGYADYVGTLRQKDGKVFLSFEKTLASDPYGQRLNIVPPGAAIDLTNHENPWDRLKELAAAHNQK